MDQVRDALDSVSKDNFGEFESTEWSIVFNLKQQGGLLLSQGELWEQLCVFCK